MSSCIVFNIINAFMDCSFKSVCRTLLHNFASQKYRISTNRRRFLRMLQKVVSLHRFNALSFVLYVCVVYLFAS